MVQHTEAVVCAAGVLHTHDSMGAMISALCTAWEWQPQDRILHALPLHHMHGLTNALLCAHAAGAAVDFLPSFSPSAVWASLQVLTHASYHQFSNWAIGRQPCKCAAVLTILLDTDRL